MFATVGAAVLTMLIKTGTLSFTAIDCLGSVIGAVL
jgi:hypothetical protein